MLGTIVPVQRNLFTHRDTLRRLHSRARRAHLSLEDDVAESLVAYLDLLNVWNQKVNLTALGEPDEAVDRLLVEPLVAARALPSGRLDLVDVGSGGGSPAIPLKLAAPRLRVRMVEAKVRKSAFLREAVRQLGLRDVVVETARFEQLLTRPELHEAADVLTVRAVRVDGKVLTTMQAFVKPAGRILLFRSSGGRDGEVRPPLRVECELPLVESLRSRLVVLRKEAVGRPAHEKA